MNKVCALFCLLVFSGMQLRAQKASNGQIAGLIVNYQADLGSLGRTYILKESEEYYKRMDEFYVDYLKQVDQVKFDELDVSDRVDYLLFKRNIHRDQLYNQRNESAYKQVLFAVPFAGKIVKFEQSRRRGAIQDGKAIAAMLNSLSTEIGTLRRDLAAKPKMTASLGFRSAKVVNDLRKALKNSYGFYNGYDPMFSWWVKAPYERADSVLGNYATFLQQHTIAEQASKDDGSGIVGHPIGKDALISLLNDEMIPYSPEELVLIANREFAWCDAEMKKASNQMGFGDDWKKALEKVKTLHVAPGEQPDLINKLAQEAISFVESNNMVTVPPLAKETWRMTMLSAKQQKVSPFFLGGEVIQIAFPTDDMDEDAKQMSMRGNNIHFARATVFHELIPGHHLQLYMNDRYKPYRNMFDTPFSVEGWALYWEMLLWDKQFQKTPEDKVGALFWRMHRCARIIFSLNYHLGKWTPQQCIDFLVDRVGHERANAEAEVRRSFTGGYGPLYQIAYMLGGLQLRALHKDLVDTGKLTDKDFHDAFLHENTIPIEMFRAIVTKQALAKDFKTNWRFAGKLE